MTVIFLITLLTFSAFFAAVETAVISLSKGKVRSLVEQKKPGSKTLASLKQHPHRLLITLLVGSTLVNIAAASLITELALKTFGDGGVGVATGITTLLVLVFGEITPKSIALQNAAGIGLIFARPIQILEILLFPAVVIFESIVKLVDKLGGNKTANLTEEELRSIIDISREEGLLDKEATTRLQSVLDFERTTVKKIMTPKEKVVSFDVELTLEEFLAQSLHMPFDRYPLFEGHVHRIIGILDISDVIRLTKEEKFQTKLREVMRPTFFVKQTERLDSILTQFRPKRASMGIATDDKGEMVGVFTSQDIVEEIVGDIFEEEVNKND